MVPKLYLNTGKVSAQIVVNLFLEFNSDFNTILNLLVYSLFNFLSFVVVVVVVVLVV